MTLRLNIAVFLAATAVSCCAASSCGATDIQVFPPTDMTTNQAQPPSLYPQVLSWDGAGNVHFIPGFTGASNGDVFIGNALASTVTATINGTVFANTVTASSVNTGAVTATNALAITSSSGSLTIGTAPALDLSGLNLLNNLKDMPTCDPTQGLAVVKNLQTGLFDCEQVAAPGGGAGGTGTGVSAAQMVVGSTVPTCNSGTNGLLWFDTSTNQPEYCNGTSFVQFAGTTGDQPPTAPEGGIGYFVITQTKYNGNLGGLDGASAACLTELTTNTNWRGYADAQSRGMLDIAHVQAFLCDGGAWAAIFCNNLLPLTTYYYARVGNTNAGGASFTTNQYGEGPGPNDTNSWASANRFGGAYTYWANRDSEQCGQNGYWATWGGDGCGGTQTYQACGTVTGGVTNYWTNATSSETSYVGKIGKCGRYMAKRRFPLGKRS